MNKPTENKVVTELNITAQEQTSITATFEQCRLVDAETGREYWTARELMVLLGYSQWRDFDLLIDRAMETSKTNGDVVSDQFAVDRKLVEHGSGAKREIKDYHLSRYACYLIAMCGDTRKPVIAAAQRFFAVKTWEMQKVDAARTDRERKSLRVSVAGSERTLSEIIARFSKDSSHIQGILRSQGDLALFNDRTIDLKVKWWVPQDRPLADILPVRLLSAKLQINNLTITAVESGDITTVEGLYERHVKNADSVRATLVSYGILPEEMQPMPLLGSMTGRMKTKFVQDRNITSSYGSYLEPGNTSGYVGVSMVAGGYIGTVSNGVLTEPLESKQMAMQTATAMAADKTNNPGAMLMLHETIMVDVPLEIHGAITTRMVNYYVSGFLTQVLNEQDTTATAAELSSLNLDTLRSQMLTIMEAHPVLGYSVVESCLINGLVISMYR